MHQIFEFFVLQNILNIFTESIWDLYSDLFISKYGGTK